MGVIGRISEGFNGLDLRGKITVALLAAALAIGGVVTPLAYVLARHQLTEHTVALLDARAQLERREIELRLSGVFSLADSLAANTVTANALADSQGRETYLDPLLRNQKLDIAGSEMSVVDYRGRSAASSSPGLPDYSRHPLFRKMVDEGKAQAQVERTGEGDSSLLVALPIRYRLTGNVEGGVLLRVPLAPLLGNNDWADNRWLADRQGNPLAGTRSAQDAFELESALTLPPPLDAIGLHLVLARDRTEAFAVLDTLLGLFVGAGLLVVIGVAAFARVGAHYITSPLREIAAAAEAIVASGRPVGRLPTGRADEFGRLAAAFNTMVDRLRKSYGELEDLVAERTQDLEKSRQEAERVSRLLDEAVQSIAVGFTVYDQDDRLVMCNEAYLRLYEQSREVIVPGASFADIVRYGAKRGQYKDAGEDIDAWVSERVARHRNANGVPIEQRLGNGRWLLIIEHKTPSGYIVGNRIDITELKNAAENLRVRELYQRATLDNLPFFFWLKDAEGHFLAVNKVFSDACGRSSPDEVVGLTDFDVWPADLAARYLADDDAVMASRVEKSVEEPVAGGSEAGWIETYKKPVIAADGSVIGTVGFARDISERRRMEQALEESEERFELAVRGANDGIWDWNPESGRCYFSQRWKSMLGYDDADIGNDIEEWRSRVHPDDLKRVLETLARHLSGKSEFYSVELRLRCKDGSYKWILCRGKAKFDDTGKAVRMSGSHTDITEQREADARLHDRNEQLNAIFSLSPDGFVSFDAGRRVKYASPAFRRMTGLDESDIAGLDEAAFSARLAAACIEQARFPGVAVLRARQEASEHAVTQDRSHARRQLIEIAGAGKRVLEVGMRSAHAETVSQILYFRDVTHETEVDRIKSEFLSTAAHELRTPMASIYGFSELMLAEDFARDEQAEFLGIIHRQAELMMSIINELLDLARIEARRGKDFVFERIDASALLQDIVNGFKPPDGRPRPLLPASGRPQWLRADAKKLTQAITNVLSNAYKYSPAGGGVDIELRVSRHLPGAAAEMGSANGSAVALGIRIIDHGIGMTPAQQARVCERFYRADTSGRIPGTGLGMSIVQEIVELHGGRIELESSPGKGTAVTLWLPLQAEQAAA